MNLGKRVFIALIAMISVGSSAYASAQIVNRNVDVTPAGADVSNALPVRTENIGAEPIFIEVDPSIIFEGETVTIRSTEAFETCCSTIPSNFVGRADAEQTSEAYRINAGDELEIYVWGEERLQRSVMVLPDGTITFPLVGKIAAAGLLPEELENSFSIGLAEQYRGNVPHVTVSVIAPIGFQFSILGRVNSPGNFAPGRYINILEALSMAGGPSEFANLNQISIIREVDGVVQAIPVRVEFLFRPSAISRGAGQSASLNIESGDTIIVR